MNSFPPFRETLVRPSRSSNSARKALADTRRVLMVDDDATTRRLTALLLARAGYLVNTVPDGEAGWEALCCAHYDLLVTDQDMPYLTGLQLVERLRRAGMRLPVIIASGSIELGEVSDHPWLALSAVLHKPFESAELIAAVHRAMPHAPAALARRRACTEVSNQDCTPAHIPGPKGHDPRHSAGTVLPHSTATSQNL
jgi:CheY-like chemotaxis protein